MAFTADDLAAVEAAIAKGEASVQFADRAVSYRSIEDLLKARALIKTALATGAVKQTLIVASKGF